MNNRIVLATPAPVSHRTAEENLGLGYLAAILRNRDFDVEIVDGWLENLSPNQIASRVKNRGEPLYIGFSCYQSNMHCALETVSLLRRKDINCPIIAGGFGPTFNPEGFLRNGFDIVVRGEAEHAILILTNHFLTGSPKLQKISNISYIDNFGHIQSNPLYPLMQNIDQLPFPERDTIKLVLKRNTPVHIISSRGCAAHCVFCSIMSFQKLSPGPNWRQRSIKNFVDEIEKLFFLGVRYFKVIDDSLIEPPRDADWCAQLANEILNRGLDIHLRGSIRADRVSERVIAELKRAGFFSFSCGIENFSRTALKRMAKSASLEQNIKALEIFEKYDIYVQAGHILFDHKTTLEELEENYKYMRKFFWTISKGIFTEMYASEGTPFTKLLARKRLANSRDVRLGNYLYSLTDPKVYKVYYSLRRWHKSHMNIYDMAIDPISAPKNLDETEMKMFYNLYLELRAKDLDYMKLILQLASREFSFNYINDFTSEMIRSTENWYLDFTDRVLQAYSHAGLFYDAVENPFIC